MRLFIFRIGIMYVVCRNQFNSCVLRQTQKLLINIRLFLHTMILKFQKEIPFPENLLVAERCRLRLLIHTSVKILLHLSRKTCAQCDNSLMELFQKFHIYTRLVIIAFHKSPRHNFCQILIPFLILRKQHEMIISVFTCPRTFVKSGTRSHINLTSQNRLDSGRFRSTIEIAHAKHHPVVCDRRTVHPKFFDSGNIFFYLIGTVQQTVFRMDV